MRVSNLRAAATQTGVYRFQSRYALGLDFTQLHSYSAFAAHGCTSSILYFIVQYCTSLYYSRTQTEPVPAAHTAVQIVRFRHSTVRLYSHSSRIFSLPVTEIRCSLWPRLLMVIGPGLPGKNLKFSAGFEPRTCCSCHVVLNPRV